MSFQIVLDSIGVSIWQMAAAPHNDVCLTEHDSQHVGNGYINGKLNYAEDEDEEAHGSEDDDDSVELHEVPVFENPFVALGCDDGCVRVYSITSSDELTYNKSLPRVSGEISTPSCQLTLFFDLLFVFYLLFFSQYCFQGEY